MPMLLMFLILSIKFWSVQLLTALLDMFPSDRFSPILISTQKRKIKKKLRMFIPLYLHFPPFGTHERKIKKKLYGSTIMLGKALSCHFATQTTITMI
ncbi:hypothetical protein RchiOBHm_Chr6g0274271 [Rosa chinensis]|uniref:Secreted protein n=1 Tax=Rosa chinensis TaxID=74649 RepID=A0A2P6PRP0_ROSCH|nr:hypothetical protein RchiOBHm_Chr6g0274271 [Rosa chinensis]